MHTIFTKIFVQPLLQIIAIKTTLPKNQLIVTLCRAEMVKFIGFKPGIRNICIDTYLQHCQKFPAKF